MLMLVKTEGEKKNTQRYEEYGIFSFFTFQIILVRPVIKDVA